MVPIKMQLPPNEAAVVWAASAAGARRFRGGLCDVVSRSTQCQLSAQCKGAQCCDSHEMTKVASGIRGKAG